MSKGMIGVIIDSLSEIIKPTLKDHESFGIFHYTPKKRIPRIVSAYKDKTEAERQKNHLYELNKHKTVFEVHKMTYIFSPEDFILLDETEAKS